MAIIQRYDCVSEEKFEHILNKILAMRGEMSNNKAKEGETNAKRGVKRAEE